MRPFEHSLAVVTAVAAAPIAVGALALQPSLRVGVRQRLGGLPRLEPGSIWIHGASVGEMLAATRLIDQLRDQGRAVFTSATTVSGRDVMRRTRPDVRCELAPLDHPWCVEAALSRIAPTALALVETELWPTWIAAAQRRGIPVVVVSGRVSDRSFPRYRRLGWLVRSTLGRLAAVGARTPIDRDRFVALGAPPGVVSVTGDLKLEPQSRPKPLAPDLECALEGTPLLVAGSTHAGEESAALDALAHAEREGLAAALVVAPRHPERAGEVAALVRRSGRTLRRRSSLRSRPLGVGGVLLLDTIGELASLYSRARVAFVGGSLVPAGGHNVLEPVLAGCPVLFGRYTANVRAAAELLERCGAGRRVEDAVGLARAAVELLRDPAEARARAERGRRELARHRGSARRTAALLETVLAAAATEP